jgi:hypothetical protein
MIGASILIKNDSSKDYFRLFQTIPTLLLMWNADILLLSALADMIFNANSGHIVTRIPNMYSQNLNSTILF